MESRPCTGGLPASDIIPSFAHVVANNWASPLSFARMTFAARLSIDARIAALSNASVGLEVGRSGDAQAPEIITIEASECRARHRPAIRLTKLLSPETRRNRRSF